MRDQAHPSAVPEPHTFGAALRYRGRHAIGVWQAEQHRRFADDGSFEINWVEALLVVVAGMGLAGAGFGAIVLIQILGS